MSCGIRVTGYELRVISDQCEWQGTPGCDEEDDGLNYLTEQRGVDGALNLKHWNEPEVEREKYSQRDGCRFDEDGFTSLGNEVIGDERGNRVGNQTPAEEGEVVCGRDKFITINNGDDEVREYGKRDRHEETARDEEAESLVKGMCRFRRAAREDGK